MISVLIPVYNHTVQALVSDLLAQLMVTNRPFEIILVDDASTTNNHAELSEWANKENIQVHHNENNIGREATRNRLAYLAKYEYLLFIDCDAKVIDSHYIQNYLDHLSPMKVFVGGHIYQSKTPLKEHRLHWKYGKKIESRSARKRAIRPYRSFSSFNFCIPKRIFEDIFYKVFTEGYGHEDTYLGYQLGRGNIEIVHIENPLVHIGLKSTESFLNDQVQAISNAHLISEKFTDIDIRVIRWSNTVKALSLNNLLTQAIKPFLGFIKNQLASESPSIALLQLYKLYHALQ